eukprot:GHVR01115879.1.p1 GENE.GHVR01115879.1~~GHVR01115879.1.p1  ORF type:complete len:220 (-),score=62.23 GHVR01115879.1:5-664(-)
MELRDLDFGLDRVSTQGRVLNIDELSRLKAALTKLRDNNLSTNVYYWGKINGAFGNYYMAYLITKGPLQFPVKKFYWSDRKFVFAELGDVCKEVERLVLEVELSSVTPFTGIPHWIINIDTQTDNMDNIDGVCGYPTTASSVDDIVTNQNSSAASLTELHRLSVVVRRMDTETAAVPRGAHRLDDNMISLSFSFKGVCVCVCACIYRTTQIFTNFYKYC